MSVLVLTADSELQQRHSLANQEQTRHRQLSLKHSKNHKGKELLFFTTISDPFSAIMGLLLKYYQCYELFSSCYLHKIQKMGWLF